MTAHLSAVGSVDALVRSVLFSSQKERIELVQALKTATLHCIVFEVFDPVFNLTLVLTGVYGRVGVIAMP